MRQNMRIWETNGYRKTLENAVKEFAETNWDEPRRPSKISSDGKFQLMDGINKYEVYFDGNKIKVDQI
jgi:hypothetical protein